jgi:nicotinamidase-related amidase
MAPEKSDLHGNAPDRSDVALLLVDVINDLDFDEGDKLLAYALPMARRLAELKVKAARANVPVIYANDNFGRWRSDFRAQIEHCLKQGCLGKPLVELLRPSPDDYFVLKPKHSAFYHTALELLLRYLGTKTLVIGGLAGNICVLFTANDAYMRDLHVVVPADCTASNSEGENRTALELMRQRLKADTRPSSEWDFEELRDANR